jgi:hypothetical protein
MTSPGSHPRYDPWNDHSGVHILVPFLPMVGPLDHGSTAKPGRTGPEGATGRDT